MALKLKYTDEHGIVHINMSPTTTPKEPDKDLTDPKFDTINNRFAQYDLFGGKYDVDSGGETPRSLFRSRYNSIEEELANTPYAFTTERSLRLNSANKLDITIQSRLDDTSPSKDIEDDRFFKRKLSLEYDESLFGPQVDFKVNEKVTPAFTVTQLIHAQDRYFDLSGRQSESPCGAKVCSDVLVNSPRVGDEAFRVLGDLKAKEAAAKPLVTTPKRKKESSFAILAETPVSRPTSPRSLPVDIRARRVSPFRGSGFRAETSRHNTPRTSTTNSRANSPPRRRTNSLPRIDKMAQTATLPIQLHILPRPHSPRNFLKENIEGVRELSELNREKNKAEAERKRIKEEEALLKEMGLLDKSKSGSKSIVGSKTNSRSNSPGKINLRSRSNSPSAIIHYENIPTDSNEFLNDDDGMRKPVVHRSRVRTISKSQPQSSDGSPTNSKIPQRQSSQSPSRPGSQRDNIYISRRPTENDLNKNQRFISNSTSNLHETIKLGSQVHDKRTSKSTQNLNISPAHIKGKPPISPGRGGPPPVNRSLSTKRLSPIVGTPNKSPDDLKPNSAKTSVKPTPMPRKNFKTAGNTPAASRLNSRQPSRTASREPSPEKPNQRKTTTNPGQNRSITKSGTSTTKSINRVPSTKSTQKPPVAKPEPKKPISRTNSVKSIVRTPSTKNLHEKPPLKKVNSKKDVTEKPPLTNKSNEISRKESTKKGKNETGKCKLQNKNASTETLEDLTGVNKQDNETQYDKVTNDKGELVILTKKNVMSMTTAAITSQPLEVVTKVTNQLPAAFEKAREKGIFERLSSKDSLVGKDETKDVEKTEKEKSKESQQKKTEGKKTNEDNKHDEKQPSPKSKHKATHEKNNINDKDNTLDKNATYDKNTVHDKNTTQDKNTIHDKNATHDRNATHDKIHHHDRNMHRPVYDDHVRLRPLQPYMYDNPQVERAKQKIEAILKEPEVSPENILTASAKSRELKEASKVAADTTSPLKDVADKTNSLKDVTDKTTPLNDVPAKTRSLKDIVDKTKADIKEAKDEVANKFTEIKDQVMKQNEKMTEEVRTEATKVIDSVISPVEVSKQIPEKVKDVPEKVLEVKKNIIEPIVTVVNEKKKNAEDSAERVNETLVKGDGEVEVQSSNISSPGMGKIVMEKKMSDGNGSDLSAHSNGGFPQSTSTTPKPPARTKRDSKETEKIPVSEPRAASQPTETADLEETPKDPNFCQRLIQKCKSKCCTCCSKSEGTDDEKDTKDDEQKKAGALSQLNCFKKKTEEEMSGQEIREMERAAGKASIEYETETEVKRPRKLRDILCACCGRGRRVADAGVIPRNVAESLAPAPAPAPEDAGCCGRRRRPERRDSILSDRPPTSCCHNRVCTWLRGMCRRAAPASSRRTSMFSKNKSMSPTLPPEDTRKKLDTSLVEHTSMIRGAVPVLPLVLAFFCLLCNIVVPGLGTIFSGMFCLCFGIPRFGVHDGAKYRVGSFVINLIVGCLQLFTVLFCLVGWGWSIWWGVIMVKTSRKYRKLKREAEAEEAEAAPPVTANNHARA